MKLDKNVLFIIDRLNSRSRRADVVGGSVRDYILGKTPSDFDITTDATPDEMKNIFSDCRTVETGIKHGTLTVLVDGTPYEITTYRRDGEYLDHRHPESVSFSDTLADDLCRRDFTVNAICYNPRDGYTDLFGGREDIERRLIRAVGDPYRRFDEDALRILRAVRFSATLGFTIEENTAAAARANAHLLSGVSGERIYAEWSKLIAGASAWRVLRDYHNIISAALGVEGYTLPDEARFLRADPLVRFFSLFVNKENPADAVLAVCSRLRTDNMIKEAATEVLSSLGRPLRTEVDIKLCLHDIGKEFTATLIALNELLGRCEPSADELLREILRRGEPYSLSHLAVDGKDMLSLGIRGREVGRTLEHLVIGVIKSELSNDADSLLAAAKRYTGKV